MLDPSLLYVAPMRLSHRPRRSRALENLLRQRWDLEQYKDSGQNYDLEGFRAYRSLISQTDFHNQLALLLRTQHLHTFCIHGANSTCDALRTGLIFLKTRSWSFRLNLKSSRDSCSLIRTIVRLLADFKHGCSHTGCSNHGNLCARGTGLKSNFASIGSWSRHSWLQSFGSRNLSPARKGCLRHTLKWPISLNFILTSKLRHNLVVLRSV